MTTTDTHLAPSPSGATAAPTVGTRIALGWKSGSATFLLFLAGLLLANLAPMIMTALGDLGFDIIAAGNILTGAMLISAVVGLGTARFATGSRRRTLALAGMVLATLSFAVVTLAPNPTVVVTALMIASVGIGGAISTSGAAFAAFTNPNRVTATAGIVNRVIVMVVLALLPILGISQISVFGAITVLLAIGTAVALWLPNPPREVAAMETATATTASTAPKSRAITRAGWVLLIAFPIWGASEDAIWTLSAALGANVGLSDTALGLALSVAAGGGVIAMLIMMIGGARLGRAIPLAIVLLLGGIIKVAIGLVADPTAYAALIVIVNLLYAFAFVLVTAVAAGLDARGTWSGPLVGAYLIGSSFAPIIGAVLVESVGIAAFGISMGVVSFVLLLPLVWAARVSERAERLTAGSPA